ncbi:SAM-dependent methyltransferase [Nocardia otitidiscaviarum]|nr:SAM-dependent methyltransferase [Nocardia otitidiscaviarum]
MQPDIEGGAVAEADRVPAGVDASRPNTARMYNYLLGGKDNYEVDRQVVHRMLEIAPDTRTQATFSREFLLAAVRMAAKEGIRQFIDIGAGIPISPNVHEVAQQIEPTARVAAIDYDPVVYAHCNAHLTESDGVRPMLADFRSPDVIIDQLRADDFIDLSEPVAVLLVGVLHFVMDSEHPAAHIARLHEVMAPGSLLIFTHGSDSTLDAFKEQSQSDTAGSAAQVVFRTKEQVERLLDGFEIVQPGVVTIQEWLADELPQTGLVILGGIGRKS